MEQHARTDDGAGPGAVDLHGPEAAEGVLAFLDPRIATLEVGALVMVYAGATQEQARREFADPVIGYFRTFGKYVAPKLGQPPLEGYGVYTQIRDLASVVAWEQLL